MTPGAPKPRPEGAGLFDQWLQSRGRVRKDKLSVEGATLYRTIWNKWLEFLTIARVDAGGLPLKAAAWHAANPKHVLVFINTSLKPLKARYVTNAKGEEVDVATVSDISRRRYWSTLSRIYDFAMTQGWITDNPARDIYEDQVPPSENPTGAIMDDATWSAALDSFPSGEKLFDLRNRAILSLLFRLGLAPLEIRGLTVDSLIFDGEHKGKISALAITGPGINQNRTMPLPTAAARHMDAWWAAHQAYEPAASYKALFFSRESEQISPHALLKLVKDCLTVAAEKAGPDHVPVRMGPQVVRNTCLVRWLRKRTIAEVVRDAGLKNAYGLWHLVERLSPKHQEDLKAELSALRSEERTAKENTAKDLKNSL